MPSVTPLDDPGDPRVGELRRLNDGSYRRRVEAPSSFSPGCFVVEGWLALGAAVGTRQRLRSVLVLDSRLDRALAVLGDTEVEIFVADAPTVAAIVGFDLHRGVVAVAERRLPTMPDSVVGRARNLLVVEGVNDGENLGVLFRNAAALGAEGVVVDATTCDPLSRRTVRVSLGNVLTVPWARVGDLDQATAGPHRHVALTPSGDTDLRSITREGPTALWIGSEADGLSTAALDLSDVRARIPMARAVDSVNVGSAAAIAMWWLFGT